MRVRELRSADEFQQYVAFAADVYRHIPAWVPPDAHHVVAQLSGRSFGGAHTRIQPFWAEADGRILATCTGVVDDLFNTHWRETVGHVLFFEALPGHEAASRAVLDATCLWLQRQGCRLARVAFLYGWQLPLTIDAYDEVPTAFHTVNPPYYHRFLKDAGFATESGQAEYIIDFTPALAVRYQEMVSAVLTSGVTMRRWRFADTANEAALFSHVYNATFGAHWGAPQFTEQDCGGLITGLAGLAAEDLTAFANLSGETVGAVLALPDLNQALHRLKRADAPTDPQVMAEAFSAIDHGVLLSISVLESARGRGVNLAMAAQVYLAMMERGYRSASYTTVLDTNRRSRRTAEKLGGRIRRNFVVYRRELT
jgi:FR47-like protein